MFHRESNQTPTAHRLCTRSTDHCSPMFLRLFLRPKYPKTFLFQFLSLPPGGLIVSIIRRSFRRNVSPPVRPFSSIEYSYSGPYPYPWIDDRETLYAIGFVAKTTSPVSKTFVKTRHGSGAKKSNDWTIEIRSIERSVTPTTKAKEDER